MTQAAPFEVPTWLQWWWDIMVPFTAAIHWPAIGPMLSTMAIAATIWLADRGRREARRKEAAILLGLAEALETVVDFHWIQQKELTAENYISKLKIHQKVRMADHFADVFEQVKITDIPTPLAASAFVTIRAWLRRHVEEVESWKTDPFDVVKHEFSESIVILSGFRKILISEASRVTTEFGLRYRTLKWFRSMVHRKVETS